MGKGTISSGGLKGRYTVNLDYGTSLRADLLSVKTDRKAVLEAQITSQESAVATLQTALDTANVSLNTAINTYNASPKADTDKATLTARVDAKNQAATSLRKARTVLGQLELQLSHVDNDIAELNALTLTESKTVWCADYTEDATGSVAIIEINAEQPTFVIAPGGEPYSFSWGQMIARELMTGPQAYYNDAILPGVQKHKPTFRAGVITSLDYDNSLCSVRLETARSSAQDLNINTDTDLTGVPLTYMECDCYAFEIGDRVVVYFQGQSPDQPVVIGFVTNPRPCGTDEVWFLVEVGSRVDDLTGSPRGDKGTPDRIDGTYSNPYPGYTRFSGAVYKTDYCNPAQNFDPAATPSYQDTLRIRFDVGWKKDFWTSALFIPYVGVDVTSHADHYDMPPTTIPDGNGTIGWQLGGFISTRHVGVTNLAAVPRWVTATASMVPWWQQEWRGGTYIREGFLMDPVPAWTGSTPASDFYNFQGWTGKTHDARSYLYANDLDHASEWLLQYYTPPPLITIDVSGVPTDFEFVRIGGAPRCADTAVEVPVATPASFSYAFPYFTNGEYELAVVYRVKP